MYGHFLPPGGGLANPDLNNQLTQYQNGNIKPGKSENGRVHKNLFVKILSPSSESFKI